MRLLAIASTHGQPLATRSRTGRGSEGAGPLCPGARELGWAVAGPWAGAHLAGLRQRALGPAGSRGRWGAGQTGMASRCSSLSSGPHRPEPACPLSWTPARAPHWLRPTLPAPQPLSSPWPLLQVPIHALWNDGRENLLGALLLAGQYVIPEVPPPASFLRLLGTQARDSGCGAQGDTRGRVWKGLKICLSP